MVRRHDGVIVKFIGQDCGVRGGGCKGDLRWDVVGSSADGGVGFGVHDYGSWVAVNEKGVLNLERTESCD